MVYAAVDLGQELTRLPDEIGLHLQPEGEIGAVAGLGDLADAIDSLLQILLRGSATRMIEGKSANQLRFEGVGQLAGRCHLGGEIFLERHEPVLRAVFHIHQLDLADGRGDRGDVESVLILQMPQPLDLRQREFHHVLDALAHIDIPQAVVFQANGRQRGELFDCRQPEGRFVGQRREENSGGRSHGGTVLTEGA